MNDDETMSKAMDWGVRGAMLRDSVDNDKILVEIRCGEVVGRKACASLVAYVMRTVRRKSLMLAVREMWSEEGSERRRRREAGRGRAPDGFVDYYFFFGEDCDVPNPPEVWDHDYMGDGVLTPDHWPSGAPFAGTSRAVCEKGRHRLLHLERQTLLDLAAQAEDEGRKIIHIAHRGR